MSTAIDLIATCAFGLEAVVRRELEALGYAARISEPGWVHFRADAAAICRTNLWLRCADRVQIRVASYEAKDFEALFECARAADWAAWIPADGEFPVKGRSVHSQLSSVPACQRAVKKAVVESLRTAHRTPHLPETSGRYTIEVALRNDQATLLLDTTGPSLHKRGYRQQANLAPLKETLAAALVQLSFWKAERPLLDPFCGSGTIPIEAALLGRNQAPGLERSFAADEWPQLPTAAWKAARTEARDRIEADFEERLQGCDIDGRALQAARANARRAGVEHLIHFQQRPFEALSSKRRYGVLITNPPYGERIGEQEEWRSLYESMPRILRKLPTWSHFILTAFPALEKLLNKRADRRRKLYNGRLECTYFQFHGPKIPRPRAEVAAAVGEAADAGAGDGSEASASGDEAPARVRPARAAADSAPVFGGLGPKADEQAELFATRLRKRARHLRRFPTRQGITCYRLYERDIPEIPLVVDRYEQHLHITEFERPHDRDVAQHDEWLDRMAVAAARALEVQPGNVHMKRRSRQRGASQHERVARLGNELPVGEGGLQFLVNLSDYIDTGLFLDHRLTRGMVREAAAGKRFLNLFAYTGSFSVYAAAGGAVQTTTVDWSPVYLSWAQRNLELNGFRGGPHRLVQSDARAFLQNHPPGPQYDLAVVDPPTFSNSKRTEAVWDVQKDYADFLNRLVPLMTPGGVIYFSTNFRRFKWDSDAIRGAAAREISGQTVPPDFRNRRIHRCWRLTCGETLSAERHAGSDKDVSS